MSDFLRIEEFRKFIKGTSWALKVIRETHTWLVWGLAVTTLLCGVFPATSALVIKGLIDAVIEVNNQQIQSINPLLPWIFAGMGIMILEAVSRLLHKFLMKKMADDMDIVINCKIMNHAAQLDLFCFENPRFQDLFYQARKGSAPHFARFVADLFNLSKHFIQVLSLVAILVAIEPWVVPVLAPITLLHLKFQWKLIKGQFSDERSRARNHRWAQYFTSLLTNQTTMPEIKLLGLAPVLVEKFRWIFTEFRNQKVRRYLAEFIGGSFFAVLMGIAIFAIFAKVIHQAVGGVLTVGDIAIFGLAGMRLGGALESVVLQGTRAFANFLYIANLQEFLNVEPEMKSLPGLVPSASKGAIEFRNVSFTYPGADLPTLTDISFRIDPGETIALVGRNGCGKTTLVKLLARLYDPQEGNIFYDDVDLRNLSLSYFHSQIGFLFQGTRVFEATALDNMAFGDWTRLKGERDQIQDLAHQIGVDTLIENMPNGYDTHLGRQFGEYDVSGGQSQSIALARVIARNAPIQILDEPTSHLDARTEYELFRHIQEQAKGKMTILVSHRSSTVQLADRVLMIDNGQIVEQGTHQELLALHGQYERLFGPQRKRPFPDAMSHSLSSL